MANDRPIGVREVAAVAGVSRQTVSRVLNNHPSIHPDTRAKVLAAIDDLDYRPNMAARALGTNKSRTIGVLVADNASDYGPSSAQRGISMVAAESDYLVHTVHVLSHSAEELLNALDLMMNFRVEGLIIIAPQRQALAALNQSSLDVPYTFIQASADGNPHAMHIDQLAGARMATRHLLELGHRTIAHIAGPQDWLEADARMQGFLDEMSEWNADPLPPILGDWSSETGYKIGQQLARRRDVTAIFASNDACALGVLHALQEARVAVPAQVSLVGFDDIPTAAHTWPPLTTIRQDFFELGRRCVERIIAGPNVPLAPPPEPTLVVRSSTGPTSALPH